MANQARYRPVQIARAAVEVRETPDAVYVRARAPLETYAARTTDRLLHWAEQAPGRSYMARKEGGAWRHLSYRAACDSARALGEALLRRGLSAERPVLILSGNDLEHAQLALACQYAGVPYAPVSPAYSLQSLDFGKLRHVVELLRRRRVRGGDPRRGPGRDRTGTRDGGDRRPHRDVVRQPARDAAHRRGGGGA
jgi:feruloyl-CoA synthase